MKLVTILFLRRGERVLLAMKKRGFGAGKWNGVGGKVRPKEAIVAAAIRECREEIGVTPLQPKLVGNIKFFEKTDPSFGHDAYVYVAEQWDGEPEEREEMRPEWFAASDIPYEKMWVDDAHWLPLVLAGQPFTASFTLDGDRIDSHDIQIVQEFGLHL